jgi:hypothetical protein
MEITIEAYEIWGWKSKEKSDFARLLQIAWKGLLHNALHFCVALISGASLSSYQELMPLDRFATSAAALVIVSASTRGAGWVTFVIVNSNWGVRLTFIIMNVN